MTIEIGRLCVKIAGRDAGKKGIVINILDKNYVLIDGEVRRKRCNVAHIEPLDKIIKIQKDASHGDVARALKEIGIEARQTKPKQVSEKPKKKRKTHEEISGQKKEKKKLKDTKPKKEKASKESSLEEKAGASAKKEEKSTEEKE